MEPRPASPPDLSTLIEWVPDEAACRLWAGPTTLATLHEDLSGDDRRTNYGLVDAGGEDVAVRVADTLRSRSLGASGKDRRRRYQLQRAAPYLVVASQGDALREDDALYDPVQHGVHVVRVHVKSIGGTPTQQLITADGVVDLAGQQVDVRDVAGLERNSGFHRYDADLCILLATPGSSGFVAKVGANILEVAPNLICAKVIGDEVTLHRGFNVRAATVREKAVSRTTYGTFSSVRLRLSSVPTWSISGRNAGQEVGADHRMDREIDAGLASVRVRWWHLGD